MAIFSVVFLVSFLATAKAGECNLAVGIADENTGIEGSISVDNTLLNVCGLWPIEHEWNIYACHQLESVGKLIDSNFPQDLDRDDNGWGIDINDTLSVGFNGCTLEALCSGFFGRELDTFVNSTSCQYGEAERYYWGVKLLKWSDFCAANFSNDTTEDEFKEYIWYRQYQTRTGLRCCANKDYCNQGRLDFDQCTENTQYSEFMQSGYDCWGSFKYLWLKYITCTQIQNYIDICVDPNSNRYDPDRDGCTGRRRNTCTRPMKRLLTGFGNCVCQRAVDQGNTVYGGFLAETFEQNWNRFCPGLNLTCDDGTAGGRLGAVIARYRLTRIRIRVNLLKAYLELPEDEREAIRKRVAEILQIEEGDVTITDTWTRRRLTDDDNSMYIRFDLDGEDEELANEIVSGLDCTSLNGVSDSIEGCDSCTISLTANIDDDGDSSLADNGDIPYCAWTAGEYSPSTTTSTTASPDGTGVTNADGAAKVDVLSIAFFVFACVFAVMTI